MSDDGMVWDSDEQLDLLWKALRAERKAFKKKLKKEGEDESYYAIRLEGFVLGSDCISVLKKVTLEEPREQEKERETE